MLRTSFAILAVALGGAQALGQATSGLSGFGTQTGINSGFGSSIGAGTTGTAAGGTGGGTTAPSMLGGTSFGSFDATFGAAQLSSAFSAASGLGGAGRTGLGGLGGFGGGLGGFRSGAGGFGGFGGAGGRGGFNNQNNQQQQSVRAVVRIGFPYAGPPATVTAQKVSDRFTRMPLPARLGNVQIAIDGRTAVLSGQIDSPEDSKLVENLLSLEPGIDDVRNELIVVSPAPAAPELVPAPR